MTVRLLRLLCVVYVATLQRADHSSRGALPSVCVCVYVCVCVWCVCVCLCVCVVCVCVCDIQTSTIRQYWPDLGSCATEILCCEDRKYSIIFVLFSLSSSNFPFLRPKYLPQSSVREWPGPTPINIYYRKIFGTKILEESETFRARYSFTAR